MKKNNFAVLILTNNRPNKVITIETLRRLGYTGRIVLVLDDLDKSASEYRAKYPNEEFYIFSKGDAISITDSADNTNNPRAVVYARNMCFRVAKDLGLENFLVLDDDYSDFLFVSDKDGRLRRRLASNLDKVFSIFTDFLNSTPTQTICFAQGGDFMGGDESKYAQVSTLTRKAMNSF